MDAQGDRHRQRLAALLSAPVELVHAPARMQRYPEPVLARQHQPVKACGIDPAHRIARRELAGGDVGRGIHLKVRGDGQLGEIDLVALVHDFLPGRGIDQFARDVFLAALAKRRRQIRLRHAEAGGKQLAIARDIGDHRHAVAFDVLVHDHRALARALQREHERSDVELGAHRFADAQYLIRIVALHHVEKTAHALGIVHRCLAPLCLCSVPLPRSSAHKMVETG